MGANADPVVLIGQVLDTLKVEGFDDALGTQKVLGAARRGLDPGQGLAVDLGDPKSEFVGFAAAWERRRRKH